MTHLCMHNNTLSPHAVLAQEDPLTIPNEQLPGKLDYNAQNAGMILMLHHMNVSRRLKLAGHVD